MASGNRTYETDAIRMFWEPSLCVHAARCIATAPRAFRPKERPWIQPENADSDTLARAVAACPTGALRYERLDGAPQEADMLPETPIITALPNGPLVVRGIVEVRGEDGATIRRAERVALCRCGASGNRPYCDGSHKRINFRTDTTPDPHAP